MTEELNRFLRSHKVLEVENHLISNEKGALWCFCVKFIPSVYSGSENDKIKMDYKNELDEPTFKIFSQLREVRKQLASEDAVPAYAICTDQELAAIAKLKEITLQNLISVKGFGEKKREKYGERLIQLLKQNQSNEKGG